VVHYKQQAHSHSCLCNRNSYLGLISKPPGHNNGHAPDLPTPHPSSHPDIRVRWHTSQFRWESSLGQTFRDILMGMDSLGPPLGFGSFVKLVNFIQSTDRFLTRERNAHNVVKNFPHMKQKLVQSELMSGYLSIITL
jgi:hypothetical protein